MSHSVKAAVTVNVSGRRLGRSSGNPPIGRFGIAGLTLNNPRNRLSIYTISVNAISVNAFLLVILCLLSGCLSLTEKMGRVIDGSAFAETTVALYRTVKTSEAEAGLEIRELRNKAGERSVSVTIDRFPSMRLRGSMPGSEGQSNLEGQFSLVSLDYLGGSVSGWNEYSLELSGTGTLFLGEKDAGICISEAPERIQIANGRIHRYDTRLTGGEAVTNLRNRRERITVLAEWMGGLENAPQGIERKEFEKYWKPFLLPEMVSKRKRPDLWRQTGDQWIKAEDIRWNTSYTERIFPEELRAVRDSGTLLRDWEEAFEWIYLEYEWNAIVGLLSRQNTLQRIK